MALAQRMAEIAELKRQIDGMTETVNQAEQFHNNLNDLHDQGLIKQDEHGSFMVVDDMEERNFRRDEISSKKKDAPQQLITNRRQAQNFGPTMNLHEPVDDDSTILEEMNGRIES